MNENLNANPLAALKVIVVDDSPMMLSLIGMALKQLGVTDVTTTRTGDEGLRFLREVPFDLLILDMVLPDMEGAAIAKALRTEEGPNKDTKVLVVSGVTDREKILEMLKLSVNGYIIKPFDSATLQEKIVSTVRKGDE